RGPGLPRARRKEYETMDDVITYSIEDIARMVRAAVVANRCLARPSPCQAALDAAAEAAVAEARWHVAGAILAISAFEVANRGHLAHQALLQAALDHDLADYARGLVESG